MPTIIQNQIEALQRLEVDFKRFLQDLLDAGFDERQIKRLVSQLLSDIEMERPPITMIGVLKDTECKCRHIGTTKDGDSKTDLFATKGCALHEMKSETRAAISLPAIETLAKPIAMPNCCQAYLDGSNKIQHAMDCVFKDQ